VPSDALGTRQNRFGGGSELMPESNLDLGRFAEPSLLILVSLSDGPKHGYAIMTDVEAGTGRPLGPGTLYAALARLEERGFIEALEPVDRRRPYRLTALGATNLKEQLAGLEAFARLGLRRLGTDRT
jgi:DNA-binding PadR family transcriptional regulator